MIVNRIVPVSPAHPANSQPVALERALNPQPLFPAAPPIPSAHALVVHWNRPERCRQTVLAFLACPNLTVIVLDNGSDHAALARLKQILPRTAGLIALGRNRGWGAALNVGLSRWLDSGTGDFCFVSAHDALPQPGCLINLIAGMQAHPRLGILAPQYQKPEVGVFTPMRGPRLRQVEPLPPGRVQLVDFAHGTLTLYRRQCLRQIGLFDERYFAYGDEMDLSLRARHCGWEVGQLWGAVVVNPETSVPRPAVNYLCCRNALLLAARHGAFPLAVIRAFLVVLNSIRLWFIPPARRRPMDNPTQRLKAVWSFLKGEFGAPPT